MQHPIILRSLQAYGQQPAAFLPMQKGYRNESYAFRQADGSYANLILYKREPDMLARLRRANAVGNYLRQSGLPARYTLDERILQLRNTDHVVYCALYAYLEGSTIPWEAYTQAHLKHLGQMMSTMHSALRHFPEPFNHTVTDEYDAIITRMQRYFADPAVANALQHKLQLSPPELKNFPRLLQKCAQLPHQHPLHMDFVRGNILFAPDATITGIIDFEKTAWGHPLFDIARTLAFLLVDCKYKPASKIRKYFLFSGYNKRGNNALKLSQHNLPLLERLCDLFLLYDFYKFLRHNPYESLAQNEHFIRTKEILVTRKLIAQTDGRIEATVNK